MSNTSGQGLAADIPAGVDRWNWGAFLLNWIWGIGNNVFIALLMFVPLVNFVMVFVLGAKGSVWAWQNKRWESVEHFKATQRKWALWGVGVWLAGLAFFIGLFFVIVASFKSTDAFKLAVAQLESHEGVTRIIGRPITTGFPMGQVEVSGHRGSADLSFSVQGPTGEGRVYMEAKKDMGQWKIERMVFEDEASGRRIQLVE